MEEKSDFLCTTRERSIMLTERIKGQRIFIPLLLGVSLTRGAGRPENEEKEDFWRKRRGSSAEIGM